MKFISSGPFHRFLLALLALQFLLGPARADDSVILPASELQQLVAPIALYPDPLLALVLPASSFPTELAQANTYVSGGGTDFDSQDWDASIKGLAHYPDVLQMMATNSDWTNQLGAAVLAQQGDVMAAVQSQRGKAKSLGNLVSTPQQTVLSEDNSIQVVPADPQTLYVPDYDPGAVYVQPAPPAGPLVSFGIGFGMGSWIGGGFNWGGGVIFGGGFWGGGVGGGSVGWHWSSHSWSSYHSSSWSRHVWKRDVTHDHWSHPHPSYHPNHAGEHMPGWHGSGTHHPNGRGGENPDHHGGENPNGHGGEKPDHHGGDHGQPALHPNRPSPGQPVVHPTTHPDHPAGGEGGGEHHEGGAGEHHEGHEVPQPHAKHFQHDQSRSKRPEAHHEEHQQHHEAHPEHHEDRGGGHKK